MKRFIFFFLAFFALSPLKAYQTDSLQVSLITIVPHANEIYTIYGHSALRLSDPSQKMDAVFNWGMFNFRAPFFIYRFIKGETDYFLSYASYEDFIHYSQLENISAIEQTLILSSEEKEKILQMVVTNLLPENLYYRYNFLFDNCTTRIRDILEKGTNQSFADSESPEKFTFRDLIHAHTKFSPWMTFGLDLLIGSGADTLITPHQELFLPMKLKDALDNASFVSSSEQILTTSNKIIPQSKFWESPLIVGFIILFIYCIIIAFGITKHRRFRGAFAPLFFIAGISGCIIGFTTLISYHPCTSSNWNLLWLHPFHLIAFAGYFKKKRNKSAMTAGLFWYHVVNFVILSAILLSWVWLPQKLNVANVPYILCLMAASGYWVYRAKKDETI